MSRRKPVHQKVLAMQKKNEQARLAMREMKVRLGIEQKMTKTEIRDFTAMSLKSIEKILEENNELAQLHTFSLLNRTDIDDKLIARKRKDRRWF